MDGRRPNNEFIENGLENWVLVNRANLRMGSDRKVMKRKGFVVKKSSLAESEEVCSYILLLSLVTNLVPECYSVSFFHTRSPFLFSFPPFILPLPLILTFHVHAK